jgi:hypothetical protein
MGKFALVHTFVAAVHALRCFVHLTRGCILPTGKMFLDLSDPLRASDRIKVNLKNVHRPIRVRSIARSHAANRKNVLGPILALSQPSAAFCEPENCSWTYPNIVPFAGHGGSILSWAA